MSSVFTKIIEGELPAYKVYEDEKVISFLALDQINMGHCLVVPKKEVDHFFDIEDELYKHLFLTAKTIAAAIKSVTDCVRVGVAIQGFEVAHTHIHLIPVSKPAEFDFKNQKTRPAEDMEIYQKKIKDALSKAGVK
jgi:histidine triad (HIT) family protein